MQKALALLLFIISVDIFGINLSYAQTPQVHVAAKPQWISSYKPYDQKPSSRDIQGGYFYELSERQIHIEKRCEYRHYIRNITSGTGIQNGSQISISFNPAYERLDFHEVIVWRDNKPQNRLNVVDFKVLADEEEFSKFIYEGTYSANLILKDIRKGDRIEYSFSITGQNPIFNNKYSKNIYLQGSQNIVHQYIAVFSSPSRKLNMKLFNKAAKPAISDDGGLKKYVWEGFQVQPVVYSDNQPSWYNPYNYVQISDFGSWAEVADWASKINLPATNIKGSLAQLVAELKEKSKNDKVAYFRSAVKIVQDEVRYMGIEIGEYSNRANRPEKVFEQRYGDCKDKSLLLVSILKANDIEAYMVLVNSDAEGSIGQFIPTSAAFDHAVVVAIINGKQVWVDATISNQRGTGADIYFPAYGKGLVLKPGNTGLSVIPPTKTGNITCVEKFTVIKENERVQLDVKTIYTLNQADKIRDNLAIDGIAETEKNYLNYYAKVYSKIETRDSLQITDDEQKNQLVTNESYWINDFYKKDTTSGRSEASFYADYISKELPEITNQTKNPVAVDYPYAIDYTIKVISPNGWDIKDNRDAIKRDAYQFESHYSVSEDTLSLNYQFAYLKDYVPVDKLDEFKKDISNLKDGGYLSFTISQSSDIPTFNVNIWMVLLTALIAVIIIVAGIWIYRTETPGIVFARGASFIELGGWLVPITISLIITIFNTAFTLINGHYWSVSRWNKYLYATDNTDVLYKILVTFETAGYVTLIGYSVFCFILILRKRDILPGMIIKYYYFTAIFFVIDYILSDSFGYGIDDSASYLLLFSIISAGVLIPYFKQSERVEQTFIVPYPSGNYKHEE